MENQPITPNNQEPVNQGLMSNKVALVSIIVAILAVATSIVFWQKSISKEPSEQPIVTQPVVQQPDETDDWETYTNTEYGFEFKYPNTAKAPRVQPAASGQFTVLVNYEGREGLEPARIEISTTKDSRASVPYKNNNTFSGDNSVGTQYEGENPIAFRLDNQQVYANCVNYNKEVAVITYCNDVLSTFKFTDKEDATSNWKTYTNASLGFSIQHPSSTPLTMEENDQYNRLAMFGSSFEIRLKKDTDSSMGVLYGFLGSEVTSTDIKLGGVTGFKAVSQTGYGDAGQQGSPFVEFGARHNGEVYHLVFYGDTVISAEENQILASFKFTK